MIDSQQQIENGVFPVLFCILFIAAASIQMKQNKHQHKFQMLSCPMFYLQATWLKQKYILQYNRK